MTGERVTMNRAAAALIAIALLLAGAGVSYLLLRNHGTHTSPSSAQPAATGVAPTAAFPPDVVVSLSRAAVERAGIEVAPATTGAASADIRLPGVVAPNAYRQVAVTSLVSGRVTRVSAELGNRVRRGQPLAQIYSPELADAQTRYVSAEAMLSAHDRELRRTEKLVDIGAASRQELERIHAEHAAQTAAVQTARSQLELLGVPASTIDALASGSNVSATTTVAAPIAGIVTERNANVGLNVDQTTALFMVVDLATVWIVADAYEKDFSRVRVGSNARITTAAYPGMSLSGRVSYIDPQLSPETRTARIRVELPNRDGKLRLGMYADVLVAGSTTAPAVVIPRSAIQNVGDRTVVYLADAKQADKFVEREVRLGQVSGEEVEVSSGLEPGDVVVTKGSFSVRAERDRLGVKPGPTTANVQSAKVVVNERGFEPAKITLRAGAPARITFVRQTEKTCATEVVIPSLRIKRALPLNEAVTIEFTPERSGEIAFACGVDMFRGTVVVQ